MQNFGRGDVQSIDSPISSVGVQVQPLLRMVYLWMGLGLLATAVTAVVVYSNEALRTAAMDLFLPAMIVELVLVFALVAAIRKLSSTVGLMMFFAYSILNGATLSFIFMAYEVGEISAAFFTTAALFGVMTVVGFTTSVDLSKYRTYFMMGLIGLVIAMIVNMFMGSGPFDILISIVGVILFTALTAYDTQKIVRLAAEPEMQQHSEALVKMSILGALTLYLDFINLFLFLLRLFGGGRD